MVKIRIDGKYFEAKPEKNLLETCLSIGIDIPHFCFIPHWVPLVPADYVQLRNSGIR